MAISALDYFQVIKQIGSRCDSQFEFVANKEILQVESRRDPQTYQLHVVYGKEYNNCSCAVSSVTNFLCGLSLNLPN